MWLPKCHQSKWGNYDDKKSTMGMFVKIWSKCGAVQVDFDVDVGSNQLVTSDI